MRILAVAGEVEPALWRADIRRRADLDLVLACGDLPLHYLGFLAEALEAPGTVCNVVGHRWLGAR